MATIRISVDDRAVQRGLDAMRHKGSSLHEVFKALRPELRRELKQAAEHEASPEGSWAPRAPATLAALAKRGAVKTKKTRERRRKSDGVAVAGPLRETTSTSLLSNTLGRLPGTVRTKVEPRALIAESPVAWAGIHNEGGTAGNGSVIPAREFVFLSEPFLKQAERDLADFVIGGWDR